MTLPARANRATNLVIAALYIPIMVINAAGATGEWEFYYALTIGVEVLILAFILRSAWRWAGARSAAAAASAGVTADAEVDRRSQDARA